MDVVTGFRNRFKLSDRISLWLKIVYTLFVAVLVPIYWHYYGVTNFLWFSDIALILTVFALWFESSLIASMMSVSVLVFDSFWSLEFFLNLLFGTNITGLTTFMFDSSLPLLLRGLSLFHVFLPMVLLWLVYRLGYDSRALLYQIMLAGIVFPATYFLTVPSENINWVFGIYGYGRIVSNPLLHVAILMMAFPILIYLPTHLALNYLFEKKD